MFGGGAESAAKRCRHQAPAWRLVAAATAPVALAVAVAVSRVTDYMHHVEDVVGGEGIGLAAAWAAWAAKRPARAAATAGIPGGRPRKKRERKARGARGARRRRGEPGRAFVDHAPQ